MNNFGMPQVDFATVWENYVCGKFVFADGVISKWKGTENITD